MAVFRETPTCSFCGEIIAEGIYKDFSGYSTNEIVFGDSFIRWKYKEHSCKEEREYFNKWKKTKEYKKFQKAILKFKKSMDNKSNKKKYFFSKWIRRASIYYS